MQACKTQLWALPGDKHSAAAVQVHQDAVSCQTLRKHQDKYHRVDAAQCASERWHSKHFRHPMDSHDILMVMVA